MWLCTWCCSKWYKLCRCEGELCRPPCENGGRCLANEKGDWRCYCWPDFSGERCEVNHCTDYCLNGGTCMGSPLGTSVLSKTLYCMIPLDDSHVWRHVWVAARRIIHMNVYAAGFFMFFVYQFWFKHTDPCLMACRHICLHLKWCSFFSSVQIQLHYKSQLSSFIIDAALKGASSLSCEGLLWGALLRCQQWNWTWTYRPIK